MSILNQHTVQNKDVVLKDHKRPSSTQHSNAQNYVEQSQSRVHTVSQSAASSGVMASQTIDNTCSGMYPTQLPSDMRRTYQVMYCGGDKELGILR